MESIVDLETRYTGYGRSSPDDLTWHSTRAVALVDEILQKGVEAGASDIHIEPFAHSVRVRFRVDGVLTEQGPVPANRRSEVAARIKVLASLDVAEKRRPQDGRFGFMAAGTPVDVRVSAVPTRYGEKVVLRLLEKKRTTLSLDDLGVDSDACEVIREHIRAPHGLILVTGPTGSGKSTTLYAALSELNRSDINISTVEDPIEYDIVGINQTQIKPDIGLTFGTILRSFLRQDPDVLMVGEIRDRDTAEVAVRASLTGHLVLSTLHTNDAPSAVTRLIDIGVEPYLVAAILRLVVAQRLVRKLCEACRGETPESGSCAECVDGYRGRTAVVELMAVSDDIRVEVAAGASESSIRSTAVREGMIPLRDSAHRLVQRGVTDERELLRTMT